MQTITKTEAQTWIRWATDIQTRTERLRTGGSYEDALIANTTATQLLAYMLQVFVAPAEVQTQPELEFAQ